MGERRLLGKQPNETEEEFLQRLRQFREAVEKDEEALRWSRRAIEEWEHGS
jgi:hypothetical protein